MRSYALALLAASGSAAMPAQYNSGITAAEVALNDAANTYKSIAAGQTLKWGADATKLYVSYDAVGLAKTQMADAATDIQTVGVKVPVGSAGGLLLACAHISTASNKSKAIWYASPTTSVVAVTTGCATAEWEAAGCMGKDKTELKFTASAGIADNTAQTATETAGSSGASEYKIMGTSTSKLDSARTGITCHIDVEITLTSSTKTLIATAAAGLNKINAGVVQNFGHTLVTSTKTTFFKDATFFNYAPTAPVDVATAATKYSIAAGQTVAGLVVTHTVNAWTDSAKVYIDYAWKMTLTTALANGKINSATTCSKIAASAWQCAIMETTGITLSSSIGVIMKFKAYVSDAALTFTSLKPEDAANLGKVANVVKEYEMTNVAVGTAAATDIVSLPSGFVGAMLASNKWAWWKTGNKMDAAFKVFDGKVQYFSTETDAAGATAVMTLVTAYAKTAWVGACVEATCLYGAKELAATAAAAAGAGSLGLASVGAAIVLAMAF